MQLWRAFIHQQIPHCNSAEERLLRSWVGDLGHTYGRSSRRSRFHVAGACQKPGRCTLLGNCFGYHRWLAVPSQIWRLHQIFQQHTKKGKCPEPTSGDLPPLLGWDTTVGFWTVGDTSTWLDEDIIYWRPLSTFITVCDAPFAWTWTRAKHVVFWLVPHHAPRGCQVLLGIRFGPTFWTTTRVKHWRSFRESVCGLQILVSEKFPEGPCDAVVQGKYCLGNHQVLSFGTMAQGWVKYCTYGLRCIQVQNAVVSPWAVAGSCRWSMRSNSKV